MEFLQISINFLIKKTSGGTIKNGNISNNELADKLHKPIIGKFTKGKVHPPFIDKRWVYFKITNTFQKMLDESNRKPRKIWVDKGSAFYYRSIKS